MSFAAGDRVHRKGVYEYNDDGTLRVYLVYAVDGGQARIAQDGLAPEDRMYLLVPLDGLCAEGQAPEVRIEIEAEQAEPFAQALVDAPLMTELRAVAEALAAVVPAIGSPPRVLGFRHVGKPERSWIPALVATGHIELLRRFGTVADAASWSALFAFLFRTDRDLTAEEPAATVALLGTLEDVAVVRVLEHRVLLGRHAVAGWVAFGPDFQGLRAKASPGPKAERVRPAKETGIGVMLVRRLHDIADRAGKDYSTDLFAFGATRIDALGALLNAGGLWPSLEPQLGPPNERLAAVDALFSRLYQPRAVFLRSAVGYHVVMWGGAGTETYLLLELRVNGSDPIAPAVVGPGHMETTKAAARAWLARGWNGEAPAGPGSPRLKAADLPAGVLEGMKAWTWISAEDTGSAAAYRVAGAVPFFMIVVTTDADDRYVELYDVEGRPCGGVVSPDGIVETWSDDVAVVRRTARDLYR